VDAFAGTPMLQPLLAAFVFLRNNGPISAHAASGKLIEQ
jgi:hypothetical protein